LHAKLPTFRAAKLKGSTVTILANVHSAIFDTNKAGSYETLRTPTKQHTVSKPKQCTYHHPADMSAKRSMAQPTAWNELRMASRKQ